MSKDLYNKLRFAIIFRILAFSIIIFSYVVINYKDILHYSFFIYIFISLAIFLTLLYSIILFLIKKKENYKHFVFFGFFQLSVDFIVIFLVALFNGGLNDKFIFLYYLLVLISGFIFLNNGVMVLGILSAIAIGLSADLQYYFNIKYHSYFLLNPDKLLFATSTNILGILIFTWLLYHFSKEFNIISDKIIEKDEFIRNSQNFNRELFNSFSQGIIVLSDDNSVIFLNDAAVSLLQLSSIRNDFNIKTGVLHKFNIKISDIFENFPIDLLLKKGNERNNTLESLNSKNNSRRFELKHKNNTLGFAITELPKNEHKIGKYILLFRDITYIKQLELESKINEGLATAGKLAAWLAHEVRNPLSAINTSVYILSSENLNYRENDYKKLIHIIKSEVYKLDNLVNDFLGFVKIKSQTIGGEDNFEKFNLHLLLEEIISRYSNDSIKIHNSIEKNMKIFSEKIRIGQILSNLIQNAAQSLEKKISGLNKGDYEHKIIRIGSKKIKKDGVSGYVSISVSDNGEGMDEFTLKNAFKPLFTTKEKGFGLGLSIVHSIIESLGGDISIISKVGRGTLIKIILPNNQ